VFLRNVLFFAEAVFKREVSRLEGIQYRPHFIEFAGGPMDFESQDIGNRQCFGKKRSNVLQMVQRSLRVDVTLSAVNLVAIKTETIVKTLGLRRRLRDEPFTQISEGRELSSVNLEVGNDCAAGIGGSHEDFSFFLLLVLGTDGS
jgi:hypothetical protein